MAANRYSGTKVLCKDMVLLGEAKAGGRCSVLGAPCQMLVCCHKESDFVSVSNPSYFWGQHLLPAY